MNHESMIATINAELKEANTETLSLLLDVLSKSKQKPLILPESGSDVIKQASNKKAESSRTLEFNGENLPLDAIEKLSVKERGALQRSLKEQNKEWLREKFAALNALWLMVVDGEVRAWGKSMKDYPQLEQILEICRSTGKYPFIFINDDRMAIEESASVWHKLDADDYYPTLPLTLWSDAGTAWLVADFDKGENHNMRGESNHDGRRFRPFRAKKTAGLFTQGGCPGLTDSAPSGLMILDSKAFA
jgi:hypothetical protein